MRPSVFLSTFLTAWVLTSVASAQVESCPGDALDLTALTPSSGESLTTSGSTVDATDDIDEPIAVACWGFADGEAEHVYSFTLATDASLQIDLEGSDFDTTLAVVSGCPGGDSFCAYDDDGGSSSTSSLDCQLYPAGDYSIIVSGYDYLDTGDYVLNIDECGASGERESCPGEALDLSALTPSSGEAISLSGSTVDAADDLDEGFDTACGGTSDSPEHVYSFSLSTDASLQIDLEGSDFDTILTVVSGCPGGDSFCAYDDDGGSSSTSSLDCQLYPAGDYSVIVSGYVGFVSTGTGDYVLNIDECGTAPPECGNDVVEEGEECDDGNTIDGDGCSSSCENEGTGGDAEQCPGEALDLSVLTPGSGESTSLSGSTSGANDSIDEPIAVACWGGADGGPEHVYSFSLAADASLQIDLEGSDFDTTLAVVSGCPDGDSFCAYNDDGSGLASSLDCQLYPAGDYSVIVSGYDLSDIGDYVLNIDECEGATADCGDGSLDPGEECDDGNNLDGDGCSSTCTDEGSTVECGDGSLDPGEECDDGNNLDGDGCSSTCTDEGATVECGDGSLDPGEECDDGNNLDGDGCSSTCTDEGATAECGDGSLDPGEECDDGNNLNGDGCSSSCAVEGDGGECGDGRLDRGEGCDDGDTNDGDGCSGLCRLESDWICTGEPSECCRDEDGDTECDSPEVVIESGCTCAAAGRSDMPGGLMMLVALALASRRLRRP